MFSFWRPSLIRNSRNSRRYTGVLHEYLECDGEHSTARICGPRVVGHFDGGRSQVDARDKYAADARTLERALHDEPGNARYVFYLAQSYRDSDQLDTAADTYQRRSAMGGWAEEVWYSLFQVAVLAERRSLDEAVVVDHYLRAHDERPTRAEALCNLARYLRERHRFASARVFAATAVEIPRPDDALFLDEDCYSWRCLDELSIADYWLKELSRQRGRMPEAAALDGGARRAQGAHRRQSQLCPRTAQTTPKADGGNQTSHTQERVVAEGHPSGAQ